MGRTYPRLGYYLIGPAGVLTWASCARERDAKVTPSVFLPASFGDSKQSLYTLLPTIPVMVWGWGCCEGGVGGCLFMIFI